MYPPKFDYYRANSVDEAVSLLQQNSNAKLIAGGHSLLPVMKLRLADPEVLIDIGRIESLKGISHSDEDSRIGALTVHAEVERDERLPRILTEAAAWIGDPQVRNRGTVGGNVAHADPASDLPTVFMALGAKFQMAGPGGNRDVDAEDFCTGLFMTDLNPDEVLTSIVIPRERQGVGSAYAKMFNPASRYAMLGAGAVLAIEDGTCTDAHVAIGGLTPKATRARSVEQALVGQQITTDVLREAAKQVHNDLGDDLIGDIHASAAYRREVAPTYVFRALEKAWQRAA
jgi:carbon-monoxide dehydrogenase medium subunit